MGKSLASNNIEQRFSRPLPTEKIPPGRFERPANGLGNRCSIQSELRGPLIKLGGRKTKNKVNSRVKKSSRPFPTDLLNHTDLRNKHFPNNRAAFQNPSQIVRWSTTGQHVVLSYRTVQPQQKPLQPIVPTNESHNEDIREFSPDPCQVSHGHSG